MNFDLFADPEPIAAAAPVTPAVTPLVTPDVTPAVAVDQREPGEIFMMTPMPGDVNRWLYKGEIVVYANKAADAHWQSVEGIEKPLLAFNTRVELCRAIDARVAAPPSPSYFDCGECPYVSTGCAVKCVKAGA